MMIDKILWTYFIIILSLINLEKVFAADRFIISSITKEDPDKRNKNVYLIAEKVDGMSYKNFTIQVGDAEANGSLYHFPNWYNVKYYPKLMVADIDGDQYEDVIVELYKMAGSGISEKEIHVLNYNGDYGEVPVEPISEAVKRLVKMEKPGDTVSIIIGNTKYMNDVTKYNYNQKAFYPNADIFPPLEHYRVEDGTLYWSRTVFISFAGSIGGLDVKYFWDGEMYKAKSIVFEPYIPEKR
jgi:hypothetical protein